MKPDEIRDDEFYSAHAVFQMGVFPWIKSNMTFVRILETPEGRAAFKPIVKEGRKVNRYFISGANVREVLARIEKGELKL